MYSSDNIVKCYEFDDVDLKQDEAKIFLARGYISQRQSSYSFSVSGVFTSPYRIFVCLPWATKKSVPFRLASSSDICSELLFALDSLTQMVTDVDDGVMDTLTVTNGREFMLGAMILRLKRLVTDAVRYNVFRSEIISSKVIRGRWLLQQDLVKTPSPTDFTCEVSECDRNHPILVLANTFCELIHKAVSSRHLKSICKSVRNMLGDSIEPVTLDDNLLNAAYRLSVSDQRFRDWRQWIAALQTGAISLQKRNRLVGPGDDVIFPTAVFFERVVELALNHLGCQVDAQISSEILGGAYWLNGTSASKLEDSLEAPIRSRFGSRPDLLARGKAGRALLVECKYKALEIVHKSGRPSKVVGLDRNDRNQVLSFVLSQSETLQFDTRNIIIVYPRRVMETKDSIPTLGFMASTATKDDHTHLNWQSNCNTEMDESQSGIRIHFIGLDVTEVIREVKGENSIDEADSTLAALRQLLELAA